VIAAVIIEPEGEPKKILRVTLPLGMQLVHGTRIIVDSNAPQQAPYVICFQNGCMSDYDVTPELIANLKKGQNLVVQAINSNGAPLTLPLPLAEFAKAYDGPPTDPKVFEETQKKLQEELQKRAAEQMRALALAGQRRGEHRVAPRAQQGRDVRIAPAAMQRAVHEDKCGGSPGRHFDAFLRSPHEAKRNAGLVA